MLSDMGQTENDKYIISHICGSKKKTKPNQTKQNSRHRKQIGGCQREYDGRVGTIGEGQQEVQHSNHKIHILQFCNNNYREHTALHNL